MNLAEAYACDIPHFHVPVQIGLLDIGRGAERMAWAAVNAGHDITKVVVAHSVTPERWVYLTASTPIDLRAYDCVIIPPGTDQRWLAAIQKRLTPDARVIQP